MDKAKEIERFKKELNGFLSCDIQAIDLFSLWDSSLDYAHNKSLILSDLKEKGLIKADTYNEFKEMEKAIKDADILEAEEKETLKAVFTPEANEINFKALFDKPKIISLIANCNEGKSNMLYYMLFKLMELGASLFAYGLKKEIKGIKAVYSLPEIEQIKDSILIIDEFYSLMDIENRKEKRNIEAVLRLINHNNNIILLCGMPENMKKFISAKVNVFIFKKSSVSDFINGSRAKNILLAYRGKEMGSTILELPINEAIIYDGREYNKVIVPYIKETDTKIDNKPIIPKRTEKKAFQNVPKRTDALNNIRNRE